MGEFLKTAWIHPFNGIAGDMTLGALIGAGANVDYVRSELAKLGVDGWRLNTELVSRNGIGAMNVTVDADEGHVHRTAGDIVKIVEGADYPERVTQRSVAVFRALAQAEARIHQTEPDLVHFHEVGGIDAIVDVVGSCLALEDLGIDRVVVATVALGNGLARSAHGIIPNPAPATALLLEGVPVRGLDVGIELTTPTGAALVKALADDFGSMPAMTVTSSGFGAGDKELESHPNLLHVIVGEGEAATRSELLVLEANVDDLSGEYLSHTITQLLAAGALDAWLTPIDMKRGRIGSTVSALIEPQHREAIGQVLLAETGSLGYRTTGVDRTALDRRIEHVQVEGQDIRIKISNNTSKAEYVDVAAAAEQLGRPARTIAAEAERIWTEQQPN